MTDNKEIKMKKKTLYVAVSVLLCLAAGFGAYQFLAKKDGPPTAVESINPGSENRQPNSVYISTDWQADDTVDLHFNINQADAAPVFAAVMNFSYNAEALEYVSYDAGDYFDQAGSQINQRKPIYLVAAKPVLGDDGEETGESRLAVGISLFKGSPGMKGSGRLITLKFRARQKQFPRIIMTKKKIVGTDAKEITQISWPDAIRIKQV